MPKEPPARPRLFMLMFLVAFAPMYFALWFALLKFTPVPGIWRAVITGGIAAFTARLIALRIIAYWPPP